MSVPLPMRLARWAVATLGAAAICLSITNAEAAGKKDAEATKLIDQAMNEDYLNVDMPGAEKKLDKALKACGSDNCSPEVVGKIHIAMATVHGLGESKMDVAKTDFANALKADPNAKLLDGLTSPEFEAAFKEAKAAAGNGGAGGEGGNAGSGGNAGTGGSGGQAPKPQGDFQHNPLPEGQINTPLPIFAEVPDEIGATKVIVRYKPYGGSKWETLPLKKLEGGFGAYVPCEQVSSAGEFKYYIIATDEQGISLAGAGSLKDPFKVPIRSKLKGEVPALPGEEPPKQCMAKGECPPGLLGCGPEGGHGDKVEGMSCDATPECAEGLICLNGECAPGGETPPKPAGNKKNLISLSGQFDFAYISDGTHVCDQASSSKAIRQAALASYTCADEATGNTFYGHPANVKGTDGISGGLGFAHFRILAGYDRILPFGLTLGARIGYYTGGPPSTDAPKGFVSPNPLIPLHFEARGGWMLAKDGVKKGMIVPHAFIGGGFGSVDPSVPVTVCNGDKIVDANNDGIDDKTPKCPGETKVDAYQLGGTGFFDFGGGATYMIVDNFGVQAELKFMITLPTTSFAFAPVIAPVVAF